VSQALPLDRPAAGSPRSTTANPQVHHFLPVGRRIGLRDVPRYGPVIRVIAMRDLRAKYKQSLLGAFWVVGQPLAFLAAVVIGFGSIVHRPTAHVPYTIFALVGLSAWMYFLTAANMATVSLIGNFHLVRRTQCPRLALPVAGLIANLPQLAVTVGASVIMAAAYGAVSIRLLLLPVAVAWLLLFTAGVVLNTSALAVRYRDIGTGLPVAFQLGLFVSPVAYPLTVLSKSIRTLVAFNPITGMVETWRWVILTGPRPDLLPFVVTIVFTFLALAIGWRVFGRLEVTMADDI
jgi:lipopolysaccharide transport system permease protein